MADARAAARAMLQELMGSEALGAGPDIKDFRDDRVCKAYLCGFCPVEAFHGTKRDIGACPLVHDDKLRSEYEEATSSQQQQQQQQQELRQKGGGGGGVSLGSVDYHIIIPYLDNLACECERIVRDLDVRMRRAKARLDAEQTFDAESQERAQAAENVADSIGKLVAEADALSAEGKVEESLKLMTQVAELNKQRLELEAKFRSSLPPAMARSQKLRMCNDCGALLSITDDGRRLADHYGGKMHTSCVKVRRVLRETRAKLAEHQQQLRYRREYDDRRYARRSRSRSRSRSPPPRRDRYRDYGGGGRDGGDRRRGDDRFYHADRYRERDHDWGGSRDRHRDYYHNDRGRQRDTRHYHDGDRYSRR